jgi:Glycosyl transferases group 1
MASALVRRFKQARARSPKLRLVLQFLGVAFLVLAYGTQLRMWSWSSAGLHVVFVHYAPPEKRFGSDVRLLRLMQYAQQDGHRVSYLCCSRGAARNRLKLRALGIPLHVVCSHRIRWWQHWVRALRHDGSRAIFVIPVWFWEGTEPTTFEQYGPLVRRLLPSAAVVAMSDDCHSRRESILSRIIASDERPEFYASAMPSADWYEMKERAIFGAADIVTFITSLDAEACAELVPPAVPWTLLRTGPEAPVRSSHVLEEDQSTNDGREGLVFLGNGLNPTNAYAARRFLDLVWPTLRLLEPSLKLYFVGQDSTSAAPCRLHKKLCGWTWRTSYYKSAEVNNIISLGFVDDPRQVLSHRLAMVVPIEASTGVNTKLFDAFTAGIPVISTRAPLLALGLEDGSCSSVCGVENATCWLQEVRKLFDDKTWRSAAGASRQCGEVLIESAHEYNDLSRLLRNIGRSELHEQINESLPS